MKDDTIPVAIYARYSSDLQTPRSIDDQVASCRLMLRENEEVVDVFTDSALTGRKMDNREGLAGLLDAARGGHIKAVYTEGLDRLSRDLSDIAKIQKILDFNDCEIRTRIDGHDINRFMIAIKGAMNEAASEEIKIRTKRGQVGNIRKGRAAGGSPAYGYRKTGRTVGGLRKVNPGEAPVVREIFERFAAGEQPGCIAAGLNARRIPPKRGRQWRNSTILGSPNRPGHAILKNEIYIGKLVYNRVSNPLNPDTGRRAQKVNPRSEWEVCEVPALRIISDELFAAAQERIKREFSHTRRPARTYRKRTLSGILHCVCGRRMHHRGGERYRCNAHRDAECGRRGSINRDDVLLRVAACILEPKRAVNGSSRAEFKRTIDEMERDGIIDRRQQKKAMDYHKKRHPQVPHSTIIQAINTADLAMVRDQISDLAAHRNMDGMEEFIRRRVSKIAIDMEVSPAWVTLLCFKKGN